jgi:hypothetical protein
VLGILLAMPHYDIRSTIKPQWELLHLPVRVVVRDHDPETLQPIRDFLEPLGYLVECMPGIAEALSASDYDQLTRTVNAGNSG